MSQTDSPAAYISLFQCDLMIFTITETPPPQESAQPEGDFSLHVVC